MTHLSPYTHGERLYGNITDHELGYYEGEEEETEELHDKQQYADELERFLTNNYRRRNENARGSAEGQA